MIYFDSYKYKEKHQKLYFCSAMQSSFNHISQLASHGTPFTFFISYDKKTILCYTNTELIKEGVQFSTKTAQESKAKIQPAIVSRDQISRQAFQKAFNLVQQNLHFGNSYLLNLTFRTPVKLNCSLKDVYTGTSAAYRGYIPGKFTFFSPETFIKINEKGIIRTFPMKGTSSVLLDPDGSKLKTSIKEISEHNTIVDLLRNDLAIVAHNVEVKDFAYLEQINTGKGHHIWQMSSEVEAQLDESWPSKLGTILEKMLPAGSISGAPKEKTLEIISIAEDYDRGFYTGIAGHFDGKTLDSCVMIRFIAEENGKYYYCSGGGITYLSNTEDEYAEYLEKIYIPTI